MLNLIRKELAVQNYYYFYFSWGYFYGAGYFAYKKIINFLSNGLEKICILGIS